MKLIALGDNSADIYRNTGEMFPGGNAVNVAVHAARQGAQAEYLGAFGDDSFSREIRNALGQSKVDYSHCPIVKGKTTKLCRYDVTNGERKFIDVITGDTWVGPLQLQEKQLAVLRQAAIIVSSCNAKMPEQMKLVEAMDAVFAFDFGEKEKYRCDSYYDTVCHGIDLAMLSCHPMSEEAFAALCAPLHRRGTVQVLATMGGAGQMISVQGKILRAEIHKLAPKDTMGAGDCFLAVFLCAMMQAGWKKGQPMPEAALRQALAAAQAASAQNCLVQGGFGSKIQETSL